MRAWKSAELPIERVYLYLADHQHKFFTTQHVASQIGMRHRECRRLVKHLVAEAKIEGVETVSSLKWGRPRVMYRSVRSVKETLRQLEVFRDSLAAAEFGDPYG